MSIKKQVVKTVVNAKVKNEAGKFMNKLWDLLDKGFKIIPFDGKKTAIGLWGTYLITLIEVLDKIALDPNFHALLNSAAALVPSWSVYITLIITGLGHLHKFVKFMKGVK